MIKIYNDINRAREEIKSIKTSFEQHELGISSNANGNGHTITNDNNFDLNNNGFTNIELNAKSKPMNTQSQTQQNYFAKLLMILKDPSTRHCLLIGICLHIGMFFDKIINLLLNLIFFDLNLSLKANNFVVSLAANL